MTVWPQLHYTAAVNSSTFFFVSCYLDVIRYIIMALGKKQFQYFFSFDNLKKIFNYINIINNNKKTSHPLQMGISQTALK